MGNRTIKSYRIIKLILIIILCGLLVAIFSINTFSSRSDGLKINSDNGYGIRIHSNEEYEFDELTNKLKTHTNGHNGIITFSHKKYGFELKYPNDFIVYEDSNSSPYYDLDIRRPDNYGNITISVWSGFENITKDQYFTAQKERHLSDYASMCQTCASSDLDAEFDQCMITNAEKINISGLDGYYCKDLRRSIYVFHNDYLYEISGGGNDDSLEYQQIFNSLKFID